VTATYDKSKTVSKTVNKSDPKSDLFSQEELSKLDRSNIPYHVAIIPDGNRRWAKFQGKDVPDGYTQGTDTLVTIVKAAKELGVKVLTVFSFSTENWTRPKVESDTLIKLIEEYLKFYQQKLLENSIRFNAIGDTSHLPPTLVQIIEDTKNVTRSCTEFDLVLALNYGGRDEICRAVKKIVTDCVAGKITPDELTEKTINSYLDTSNWPDPDLLIRTSGERRISNFLLWQSSYTELYIEEDVWPNFQPKHLLSALVDYQHRDRRRGGGMI
jgi:undecaprenyl diphosphate synthase